MQDVAQIKTALIGNEKFGQRGLIGEVHDINTWRTSMNDKFLWVSGAVAASWFFVSALAYIGYEWMKAKLGRN